jgi:hypothetical protein
LSSTSRTNCDYDKDWDVPDDLLITKLTDQFLDNIEAEQEKILATLGQKGRWQDKNFNKSQMDAEAAKKAIEKATAKDLRVLRAKQNRIKVRMHRVQQRQKRHAITGIPVEQGMAYNKDIAEWKSLQAKIVWLNYQNDWAPIFHPKDSIQAIRIEHVPKKKGVKHRLKNTLFWPKM